MKHFSLLLRITSKRHSVDDISEALGITPDFASGIQDTWQLSPKRGQSFRARFQDLMDRLPQDFPKRLRSIKGTRGVFSIALWSDEPVAELGIPKSYLTQIVSLGLSMEVAVFSRRLDVDARDFAA